MPRKAIHINKIFCAYCFVNNTHLLSHTEQQKLHVNDNKQLFNATIEKRYKYFPVLRGIQLQSELYKFDIENRHNSKGCL